MANFELSETLKNGYFLIDEGEGRSLSYHVMQFFETKEELFDYINAEYRGTVADAVAKFTLDELISGQDYSIGRRQGTGSDCMRIRVIHGDNWKDITMFLNSATVYYRNGDQADLSELLYEAKSLNRVRDVVEIYNASWDNYW